MVPETQTTNSAADGGRRPNILLVVSDQERQRGWLPPSVRLPWRERLMAEGIEFTRYYTHSSPCSPSRASLLTGRYLPGHGVIDNVIMPEHKELDSSIPTLGSLLRERRLPVLVHREVAPVAVRASRHGGVRVRGLEMATTGTSWGGPGPASTSTRSSPPTPRSGCGPTRQPRPGAANQPWFLTVALVNPHDVMWFPIDQPGYEERHPEDVASVRRILEAAAWKDDDPLPVYRKDYDEVVEELPANFHDDLHTKPEAHRQWRWDQQHGLWGYIDPGDTGAWLRHLDYYVELQRLADESLGTVLQALEDSG